MKFFKVIKDYLNNSEIPANQRLYTLLSSIALHSMIIALIAGFFIGENTDSLLFTGIALFTFLFLTWFSLHFKKIKVVSIIIAVILIFVFLPINFLTSGAIHGGAAVWNILITLYISMILSGKARIILLSCEAVVVIAVYYVYLYVPSLVEVHSEETNFKDSLASFFLVAFILVIMIYFQTYLLKKENEKTEAQKNEIDELNHAQNRFFSNMSHEIRTPINTIIGLNEMILRENASKEINEDAENIQSASKILLHLINDILDMSKLSSGQMELVPTTYSMAGLISDVVGMIWIRAKEKNLTLQVEASPTLPAELIGDEMRIKQILINILNNAVKYTNQGSVTLEVHCNESGNDNNVDIIFSITDTGIGIKKESIPYLFDAFKRVDENNTKMIEGTGLGLSIVKQFTELMGGKITVNSIYTKGSTFVIRIPQERIGSDEMGELDLSKKQVLSTKKEYLASFEAPDAHILIVDDTPANLVVVKRLLRDTKVDITTAKSGEEALNLTLENYYHVIFMDHKMPGMDGIECMHRIRFQTGGMCRDSKIVALTANAGGEVAALYEREGFDGYLMKPISGNVLESELQKLLPRDIVTKFDIMEDIEEKSNLWRNENKNKATVAITTDSLSNLPIELSRFHKIGVIPIKLETNNGYFRDSIDISTENLLNYSDGKSGNVHIHAISSERFENFFADQLRDAHNVIHISVSGRLGEKSFPAAVEAAKAFDNVTVFDSGHISGGLGLMVLTACRMAERGTSPSDILERLERMKTKINTSFIIDNSEFLSSAGLVSSRLFNFVKAFSLHPSIYPKNGKMHLKNIHIGSNNKIWKNYIRSTFNASTLIDRSMLLVPYNGLTSKEREWILEKINEYISFEHVYMYEVTPTVAVDFGPRTFGLMFSKK